MEIKYEYDKYGELIERWESEYKGMQVEARSNTRFGDVTKGTICTIEAEYFFNGQTWFTLQKQNGENFESPTIFWDFIE